MGKNEERGWGSNIYIPKGRALEPEKQNPSGRARPYTRKTGKTERSVKTTWETFRVKKKRQPAGLGWDAKAKRTSAKKEL